MNESGGWGYDIFDCMYFACDSYCFVDYKIVLMRKSIGEIASSLDKILDGDTNAVITVSSGDGSIRKLAARLNTQLRGLRARRIRYENGDRELKEAVTNISHDLRTPLTAISGYLELLSQEEKSETVEKYLDIIDNRTQALKELTEELFRYAVILAQDEITLETLDIKAVLEESILSFYGAMNEAGIVPELSITKNSVIRQSNRAALSRIFGNIIGNALKYSDGDLYVELSDDGQVTFKNHAHNLDKLRVEKLFDRFYTVQEARGSTELGLSIARSLVEQLGGSIGAEYEDGVLKIEVKV